jgi:hypothetical protein
MCNLSIPATRFDDWTEYDEERTEVEPVYAYFAKDEVDLLMQQNIDGVIIGAAYDDGEMTFTMTGWRNGNIGISLTAKFPCPDECEKAIKNRNMQLLLPPDVKFCKSHIESVLDYPGMTHVVVRHKGDYDFLGIYPAIRHDNDDVDHFNRDTERDYIYIADES